MVVSYKPLKALSLPSWSLAGFTVVIDNMGERMGGCGLGGIMGDAEGGVGEWNMDKRDRWGWAARNSSPVGRSSSRVREVSSLQVRDLAESSWVTMGSSLSLSKRKKSDDEFLF